MSVIAGTAVAMVKLLEHGMKVIVGVLEKRLHRMVTVNKMQFGFMPSRGTIDAVFMFRSLQEEYRAEEKNCFVDPDNAFDRVSRKVLEWATMKKGIPDLLVRSVMSMMEQSHESEWILSCQRSLRLMYRFTIDLCRHIFVL